ncbi:glycosyltransferase [Sphingomonas sp. Root241]|uniref:glycosyltransferase n=1 Tax=Sphingomonas sp. Root241 TaxID=1736501 RepID=UPI0006F205D0|nr:glycosyltransferase [Sphingomonas sp. Root241]KRC81724.1 hypothetical protein ASE13_04940 [Sphingomonas sp. Root241]
MDGLYFDKLSDRHLRAFAWPVRLVLRGLRAVFGQKGLAADLANFISGNWSGFTRMLFADHIVYQSAYSREVYARYFRWKPSSVVVNGEQYQGGERVPVAAVDDPIRVVTVFDSWRPSKRMGETIEFVRWANEVKGVPLAFTLLGYTGRFSADTPSETREIVEGSRYIEALPPFASFDGAVGEVLQRADLYLTFSHRDACPNVVIESMARGLPVVAIDSGGMADIVGDAGILLPANDDGSYFTAARYDGGFPPIAFEEVLQAVQAVAGNQSQFRAKVRQRFETDLDLALVADRYLKVLESVSK